MPSYQTSIFDNVFAVTDEPNYRQAILLGTAFNLGKGIFATAGHVAETLQQASRPALRKFNDDGTTQPIQISKSESWETIDFGLLEAAYTSKPISWLSGRLAEPTDIFSTGFAFGLDLSRKKITKRHFKGYVVSVQKYSAWNELDPSRNDSNFPFWTYELSFECPKGQSGAPLLANFPDGTTSVVGIIIGNKETGLFSKTSEESEEIELQNGKMITHENHFYLHLGNAIASVSLLEGQSILLGNLANSSVNQKHRISVRQHLGDLAREVKANDYIFN